MELRPYQTEAKNAILAEWDAGRDKTLLVLPTGCGKTIVFSSVVEDRVRNGSRALVLAHRGELLTQAQDKLYSACGLHSAVEKAEKSCLGSSYRVTVGSIQTMQNEKRLSAFPHDYFDTIVVDEAHHCMADTYMRVLSHFEGAKVLGVTATPDRGDQRSLGSYFESKAYEYSMRSAIKDGYLSPVKARLIPLQIDLTQVRIQNGDYAQGDVGSALDPYLEQIADEMVKNCKERKTVVFLPLVATSQRFCELLRAKGLSAAEVNGESRDRAEKLADFEAGKYNVLCNSMLLTEGWDCPSVDCIVVLRPTKVRSLYQQMVGRGMRLSPGKDYLLLLDFLWLTAKHDLCRPSSLIAKSDDIREKLNQMIEEGEEGDLSLMEEQAERDVVAEREAALAAELAAMRMKKQKLVDPLQYIMSIQAEDLADYEPTYPWEMMPPTKKQLEYLEAHGIYPDEVKNCGMATLLIDRLKTRSWNSLATPKQIRCLEWHGFVHVGEWSFEHANKVISRLASRGWRLPIDFNPATYVPGH